MRNNTTPPPEAFRDSDWRKRGIVFRQLRLVDGPLPIGWSSHLHWYVEAHDDDGLMSYPLGVAYVSAHPGMLQTLGCSALIDYIQVADHMRRKGVARTLIEACIARWPDIRTTEPISTGGEALIRALGIEERVL